ncbi:MAG: SMC family ATPase [Candidatus Eisenbacteria bacterium]
MKLLRLDVKGFGPLRGEWAFAPNGVNLVVDDNERGKSTLLSAIVAALYGLEDDRRSHRVLTPLERWRPWQGGEFRLELELEVAGRRLRIARDFDRGTVTVFDGAGREVTPEFVTGRDDGSIGQKLLGLDSAEFEKCAFVRQGDLDAVVPGDEKARRGSTLKARLENAADTHIGDTNASEALRVLEDALRRYNAPELEFTGTVENAVDKLEAKCKFVEADLHDLDQQVQRVSGPLETLGQLAQQEEELKDALRRLDAERQSAIASDIRRGLEANDAQLAELRKLEEEAAGLEVAAQLPANAESELRDTVARVEEAQRNLETLEARRRDELAKEREGVEAEVAGLQAYERLGEDDANRCVALAAQMRQVALDDTHHRHQVFQLRDQLAGLGYEPERIQFLTARFGALPDEHQRLLRQQADLNLAFQTEVATLEQERTGATEALRNVDADRNRRRVPAWVVTALGAGAAAAGGVVFATHGPQVAYLALLGGGAFVAAIGAALLAIAARAQTPERDVALRKLADAQRRLNTLRSQRAENEVGLADLSRLMGYRDSVDLMRHWGEYARMMEDSAPLLRAQEMLAQNEASRRTVAEQAAALLRGLPVPQVTPEALERVAYEARRAAQARQRLAELDKSWEWVQKERAVDEAAVAGLRERAVRILHSAGLAYDPERTWQEHVDELHGRLAQRSRHAMLVEELIPFAKKRLLPEIEVEQRRASLAQLEANGASVAEPRPAAEIEAEAQQARTRLEGTQRRRSDLRLEVEEVWRRHATQRPELEAQIARLTAAAARARAFKRSVEIARSTIQKVATDTHRRWADFLNSRVGEVLGQFGTHVEQLRFGEDLDFSVQMDGGPQVTRGKAHLQLSSGARDQLYLAVRLAVSEYLSRGGEALPMLLDDAFATSDDARLEKGMRALVEGFGAGHQVIVVTCHRGRHQELRTRDPETFIERMHWLDLRTNASATARA